MSLSLRTIYFTLTGAIGALAAWERGQLTLGARLLERTRTMGRRSQVDNTWTPGDPDLMLGLYGPGR